MASKSKKRRKVLGASCILAALIIAGSSFAWFTGKDEVTNRLTASAEYGVAIAENFQPPETWVPGQEINKDAAAVNTGNVDAFVRMKLEGDMRLLKQNTTGDTTPIAPYVVANKNFGTVPTTAVTDTDLLKTGITLSDDSGNYYKTLSTTQAVNAHQTLSTSQEGYPDTTKTALSEVQAMQSGILAYAPDDAEYTYILNEETELPIYVTTDSGTSATYITTTVPAGTLVHVVKSTTNLVPGTDAAQYSSGTLTISKQETVTNASGTGTTNYKTVYVAAQAHNDTNTFFVPQNVEYETFTPVSDGLYLFLRNESSANQANPEFSGYYKKTQDITNNETNSTASDQVVYYALNTDTQRANDSEYTVAGVETTATYAKPIAVTYDDTDKNILHVVPSDKLELFTAQYIDASTNLIFFSNADDNKVYAAYIKDGYNTGSDVIDFEKDEDVVVEINLSGIGTTPEGWTAKGASDITDNQKKYKLDNTTTLSRDASKLTFYYNNDLEPGDTSAKLVDQVKLYEGVTNKAYLAFDFDLDVLLESVQVTYSENGTESAAGAVAEWNKNVAGSKWTGASATATMSASPDTEIASVAWADVT